MGQNYKENKPHKLAVRKMPLGINVKNPPGNSLALLPTAEAVCWRTFGQRGKGYSGLWPERGIDQENAISKTKAITRYQFIKTQHA